MNGPIAQMVSLVAYTNEYLRLNQPCSFNLNHSTAQFCEVISFVDRIRFLGYREREITKDTSEWAKYLKKLGVKELRLHYEHSANSQISDRISSAFVGGGGRWIIEACYKRKSDYWLARWEVNNREAKDRRIWIVTYIRFAKKLDKQKLPDINLDDIARQLNNSLEEIKAFSDKHELNSFSECFNSGQSCLVSNDCLQCVYHKDLVPNSFDNHKALRLLSACQAAWVFGGMGSWNDLAFEDSEQVIYEKVSNELFSIVCKAISMATNSLS